MDIFKKMKIIKALENCEEMLYSNQVFNAKQCKNLVHHLSHFIQRFQEIFELDTRAFQPLLKVLKVSSKAEMLVQSCSQAWSLAPLIQMQNKEAFRELLLEMASCLEGLFDIATNMDSCLKGMENIVDFQSCVTNFLACDLVEVGEDQADLCKILENKLHNLQPRSYDYELANYVLQWREYILKVEGGESDVIQFLPNVPSLDFGPFSTSLAKDVYLTKWLGIENVTKKIDLGGYDECDIVTLEKEVRIMAQLNHPNIVKLFYCGSFKDSFGNNHLQFGMERGDKSLHKMLFEDPNQSITFHAKLDIMLQIVSGMLYLHDMKVAHRDLKPTNIVVNMMQCPELQKDGYVCAKLIDFGISKNEVRDNVLVMPSSIHGTHGYMALEATKFNVKLDPLKTDVFSFGLICCDILIQKQYENFRSSPFEIAKRQKLSLMGIPLYQKLHSLIEECLSMDPNGRPSFAKIYTSLMEIKKKVLKTQCTCKTLMREDQIFSHSNLFTSLSSSILTIRQWWLYLWRLIVHYLWTFILDCKQRL